MPAEQLLIALARAAILLQRDDDDAGAKALADHLVAIRMTQIGRTPERERDELRVAVEYYAAKETWDEDGVAWHQPHHGDPQGEANQDCGTLARTLLRDMDDLTYWVDPVAHLHENEADGWGATR